jgi:anti-sigma factor RsiW
MSSSPEGHVEERFSEFVEGDLSPEDKATIDRHLAVCTTCRVNLDRFRNTIGRLGALRQAAPTSFLPDIQKQIRERSRGRFFGKRWKLFGRIPFEWVSLAMIVAMLIYYIITLQSAPTGVSPSGLRRGSQTTYAKITFRYCPSVNPGGSGWSPPGPVRSTMRT